LRFQHKTRETKQKSNVKKERKKGCEKNIPINDAMVTKKAVAVSLTSETRQRRGSKKKIDVLILLLLLRQTRGQSSRAGKLNACRSLHARKITRGMESGSVVTERSLARQLTN
jgi:hypothetical protein